MWKYIIENKEPIALGFCIAFVLLKLIEVISDIIVKIAILNHK